MADDSDGIEVGIHVTQTRSNADAPGWVRYVVFTKWVVTAGLLIGFVQTQEIWVLLIGIAVFLGGGWLMPDRSRSGFGTANGYAGGGESWSGFGDGGDGGGGD
ncbi:MAG: hypothetical protein ABJQ23_14015 [Shimia thalassica]